MSTPSYPFLGDDIPDTEPEYTEPVPCAPGDPDVPDDVSSNCGVCHSPVHGHDGDEYLVLSCAHRLHFECFKKLFSRVAKIPDKLGAEWCGTCETVSRNTGVYNGDARLEYNTLVQTLHDAHTKAFRRDYNRITTNDHVTPNLERALLGSSGIASKLASFAQSLSASKPEQAWPEPATKSLFECMVERGRTLDAIFEGSQIDLADLFVAGVQTLDELHTLGFNETLHLTRPYRKRLPIFALVSRYQLSWDNVKHLAPATIRHFRLSAPELRLLGADFQSLLTAKLSAEDVMALGINPSDLILYLGMQAAHLGALGINMKHIMKNKRWLADFERKDSSFRDMIVLKRSS